jgi:hypothetical protein
MKQYTGSSLIITCIIILSIAWGQVNLGPRVIGTAGTFLTQSRGDDVIGWNPANLGYPDNPEFTMSFGVIPLIPFPSFDFSNSALSVKWLEDGFFSGDYLDDSKKNDLLDAFPEDGWALDNQIKLKFLGIASNNFAFSISAELNANFVMPRELMELVLFGNQFYEIIPLNNVDASAQVVFPFAVAYGTPMEIPFLEGKVDSNYVGLGVKFLWGFAHGEITEFDGDLVSAFDHVTGTGSGEARTAENGFGLAFDLGWSGQINDRIKAGLALNNLFGFINWSDKNAERYIFDINANVEVQEDMEGTIDELEDATTDTSFSINGYRTSYPTYLMAGIQYEAQPDLSLTLNYRQHFSDQFNYTTTPRLSGAALYDPWGWMPLRIGLSVGGYEKFQWGIGFGFHGEKYAIDFGFAQDGGFFNSSRGLAFSIGQRLIF